MVADEDDLREAVVDQAAGDVVHYTPVGLGGERYGPGPIEVASHVVRRVPERLERGVHDVGGFRRALHDLHGYVAVGPERDVRAVLLRATEGNQHDVLAILLQPLLDFGERHRQQVVLALRARVAPRVVLHVLNLLSG